MLYLHNGSLVFRRASRRWARQPITPQLLIPIRAASSTTGPRDADIVVVGAGIAGVCASIAAAEKGASVLLLDGAHGGGATALSGGVVYAGGGTDQQKEAGYNDTPENMFAYLKKETSDAVDEETLKEFCDGSVARLKWMEKHGARFEASLCPYKTSYPTDKHYLYFSGNEKSYPYNEIAKPAPRGHRVAHPGFSGSELWRVLFDSAKRMGVRFLPTSKVKRVLFDANGRASGVELKRIDGSNPSLEKHKRLTAKTVQYQLLMPDLASRYYRKADLLWRSEARPQAFHAPAVILAAGGFAFNPDMRQQHLPKWKDVVPLGTRGDDGSGITIGQTAGGATAKLDRMSAWRFLYPPTALLEGVVVSRQGKRMIAEDVYGATLSEAMIQEHEGKGFLILDAEQWAKAKNQVFKQTQSPLLLQRLHWLYWDHKKAASLESLAAKFGISADGLRRTVGEYNDAIAAAEKDPFHKVDDYRSPILKPPFYGVDISARLTGVQAVMGLTLGGLRVDGRSGLVLREGGEVIHGLYAAGRTAAGVCANGYVSGLSIADGVFAGKRAGEHAASAAAHV